MLGFALLGVLIGATGAELLRAMKPEMIERIEDHVRCYVNSFFGASEAADEEDEETGETVEEKRERVRGQ